MGDLTQVDYFNALDLVANPYPYFEHLRALGPVVHLPAHNVVAVTGWEEGFAVLRDAAVFSSINAATGPLPRLPFVPEGDDISNQIDQFRDEMPYGAMLVTQDPPAHTRSRSLLAGLLTPKRFRENEEFMWGLADRMIDEFIDSGRVEIVSAFAHPFSTLAIAELLGVPEDDYQVFRTLIGTLPGQIGGDAPMENNPMARIATHFYGYIADRRAMPREDVMTRLAQATYADGSLPDIMDVVSHASVLFGAGQDTTVRLIAAMFKTLGEDPSLQARLRNERDRIPNFIEEVLRLDGPVKASFRLARRAARIGDIDVVPGTTVMLLSGAMNRDPRKFPNPNHFDLERKNVREHLAFGRGIHACIGAPLARAEARLALERIFERIADISIDASEHGPAGARHYDYEPNYTQRALRNVHLTFRTP